VAFFSPHDGANELQLENLQFRVGLHRSAVRPSGLNRRGQQPAGAFDAPTVELKQAVGFSLYIAKAVLNGRDDEIIDLAKTNIFP
jgi:hypothetical protein